MKASLTLMLSALSLLMVAGCKTNPNQYLMEREHLELQQENEQLQYQLDQCQAQLESARRELGSMHKAGPSVGDVPTSAPPTPRPPSDSIPLPKIDLGTPESSHAPSAGDKPLSPRKKPAGSSGEEAVPLGTPSGEAPKFEGESQASRRGGVRPASATSEIDHLSLNRWLTGPATFGTSPGNKGITVVFAPRDSSGHVIETTGDVSIVVIDPAAEGDAKRIARWDFSAAEVTSHYRQTALVKALRFELVWPDTPPDKDELKLYVRLTLPDGRKLDDNMTLHLKGGPPGEDHSQSEWTKTASSGVKQWTPATTPIDPPRSLDEEPTRGSDTRPGHDHGSDRPVAKNREPDDDRASSDAPPAKSARARPSWSPYR